MYDIASLKVYEDSEYMWSMSYKFPSCLKMYHFIMVLIVHATLFYQIHIVVFKSRFTVFGNVMGKENVLMLLKWCRTVKLILMIVS